MWKRNGKVYRENACRKLKKQPYYWIECAKFYNILNVSMANVMIIYLLYLFYSLGSYWWKGNTYAFQFKTNRNVIKRIIW